MKPVKLIRQLRALMAAQNWDAPAVMAELRGVHCHVHPQTIDRWIRGEHTPNRNAQAALRDLLAAHAEAATEAATK